MINPKENGILLLYPHTSVKKALKSASKKNKISMSALGSEIIAEWLYQNKYLKKIKVEVLDL